MLLLVLIKAETMRSYKKTLKNKEVEGSALGTITRIRVV